MNNAELYHSNKSAQEDDSTYVIDNFLEYIKWESSKNTILDIGSGDGQTLCEILLPKISEKIEEVFGIDVSSDMLHFSRKNYGDKIIFEEMDIAAEIIPKQFLEKFDSIFSFFCLHWVVNQSLAYKNINKMLKPGGYILLTYMIKSPICKVYELMANTDKWKLYMENYRKYVIPFQHSADPEQELRGLMERIGFQVEVCRDEKRYSTYPSMNKAHGFIKSINPFLPTIPECKHNEYLEDFTTCLRELSGMKFERLHENDDEAVTFYYHIFIVVASKVENAQ